MSKMADLMLDIENQLLTKVGYNEPAVPRRVVDAGPEAICRFIRRRLPQYKHCVEMEMLMRMLLGDERLDEFPQLRDIKRTDHS